eukprot:SM000518S17826  [mRNA]  locus=s518:40:1754:- [translate_table: standard]
MFGVFLEAGYSVAMENRPIMAIQLQGRRSSPQEARRRRRKSSRQIFPDLHVADAECADGRNRTAQKNWRAASGGGPSGRREAPAWAGGALSAECRRGTGGVLCGAGLSEGGRLGTPLTASVEEGPRQVSRLSPSPRARPPSSPIYEIARLGNSLDGGASLLPPSPRGARVERGAGAGYV